MRRLKTVRRPPIYPKSPGHLPCSSLTHPLPLPSRRPSVSFGGFGVRARGRSITAAGFGDGKVFPPKGVLGGESGGPSLGYIVDGECKRLQDLPLVGLVEIDAGHALESYSTGGGGFGNPLDRDPELVRHDVRRGWVSVDKARETYGVVLDLEPELLAVDYLATERLRNKRVPMASCPPPPGPPR